MRAKSFRYAPEALQDVADIHAYLIGEAGSAIARRVVLRLRENIRRRREMPLSGAPRSDYRPDCRFIRSGQYLVYYSFDGETMTVFRILHAARDRDAIMRGD